MQRFYSAARPKSGLEGLYWDNHTFARGRSSANGRVQMVVCKWSCVNCWVQTVACKYSRINGAISFSLESHQRDLWRRGVLERRHQNSLFLLGSSHAVARTIARADRAEVVQFISGASDDAQEFGPLRLDIEIVCVTSFNVGRRSHLGGELDEWIALSIRRRLRGLCRRGSRCCLVKRYRIECICHVGLLRGERRIRVWRSRYTDRAIGPGSQRNLRHGRWPVAELLCEQAKDTVAFKRFCVTTIVYLRLGPLCQANSVGYYIQKLAAPRKGFYLAPFF